MIVTTTAIISGQSKGKLETYNFFWRFTTYDISFFVSCFCYTWKGKEERAPQHSKHHWYHWLWFSAKSVGISNQRFSVPLVSTRYTTRSCWSQNGGKRFCKSSVVHHTRFQPCPVSTNKMPWSRRWVSIHKIWSSHHSRRRETIPLGDAQSNQNILLHTSSILTCHRHYNCASDLRNRWSNTVCRLKSSRTGQVSQR